MGAGQSASASLDSNKERGNVAVKKIIRRGLLLLVALILLLPSALAADWPQFLGDPAAQGVSAGRSAVRGADLTLRWEKNTGNTWDDVPGTHIVVGDFVYYYSSQYPVSYTHLDVYKRQHQSRHGHGHVCFDCIKAD